MAKETDINPVTHITADTIGPPGKRVFYLQVQQNTRTFTFILEKFQVQSLSVGVEQFLGEIQEKFSNLEDASADYVEANMIIHPPVDPIFRIGELALGYDTDTDLIILVAREVLRDEQAKEDAAVFRFWCSRSQIRALAHWGLEIVSRGRPLCEQCGAPIDPEEGHFCPKKNGHRA